MIVVMDNGYATGGTFDKHYNELNGVLGFADSHLPEVIKRARITILAAPDLNLLTLTEQDLSANDMSVRMSRHFKVRVTPAQVSSLLERMRTPSDPLHRPNVPYRRAGAKRLA